VVRLIRGGGQYRRPTAASVVYCGEFVISSNKTCYSPLIPGSFAILERLGVVMSDESEQGGDETSIRVIHELSKRCMCDSVVKTVLYCSINDNMPWKGIKFCIFAYICI
jgi:hypothetical protein